MKRTIPGIVRLLLSLPLVTGCATAPSEAGPPEQTLVQVLENVCLPHIVDGASFETVKRALDFGWSRDWPELLSSPPPGPVFRQRLSSRGGVLSFVTERIDPPYGLPRQAGCQVTTRGVAAPALIAATERVMGERRALRQSELRGYIVAAWCVAGFDGRAASVWALDYRDGSGGIAVNARGEPCL